MKSVVIVVLVAAMVLTGCAGKNNEANIKANGITVFYGFSSYAMDGNDQKVINNLLNQFKSLSFEKTNDEMDLASSFHVNLSYDGGEVSFWVDKKGTFWLGGETQSYKISSGTFDYEYLKKVYEESRRKELGS